MLSYHDVAAISLPVLRIAIKAGAAILDVYHGENLEVQQKADDSPITLADRRAHDLIDAELSALVPTVPVLSEEGRDIPYDERASWDELWLVDPLDGTKEFITGNGEFTVNLGLIQHGEPVFGVVYAPVRAVAYLGITRPPAPAAPEAPNRGAPSQAPGGRAPGSFPAPGAYRWTLDRSATGGIRPDELARRAEPVSGAAPDPRRITVIASRSHMNARTQAFVEQIGTRYAEVKLLRAGSALKLCLLADGSANIYPRNAPTMEWDTAAGHALLRAAGGEVWQAPRDGHGPVPDWLARVPADAPAHSNDLQPLRYNKPDLTNPHFVARGW